MTKTTKILLGVGAIALAYYFYTKRGKGGAIPQVGIMPLPTQNNYNSREECEKRYDKALASGNAMSAIPRESYIQNCMKQEKKAECGNGMKNCPFNNTKCYNPNDPKSGGLGCTYVN